MKLNKTRQCIPLISFIWINILYRVSCYNQLVRPGYTMAHSSSIAFGGYPNKTVDGGIRQNFYIYCMHTAPGLREAWLRIDLRKIYNLHSVKFWYRNDSRLLGHNTRRIQGFSIRLSNISGTIPEDICYQDDGKTILPPIIEKQCEGVAQYVWIYTNKTSADGAFLEICEVQVFGCSYQDNNGSCITCDHCKNDCNINGECDEQGCKSDSLPLPFCKECDPGTYGSYCIHICGHCAEKVSCNNVDGICPRGCKDGWTNLHCNETCKKGLFGKNCTRTCGHCLNKATCDHVTGSCPSGLCEPGWRHTFQNRCNQECDDGTFGYFCTKNCNGHCTGGFPCRRSDGICIGGCEDGWTNQYCNETCNVGWFGRKCTEPCGYCRGNKPCHHVTGSCSGLCEPGYSGDKCAFSEHLANQREMIKLIRELLADKRRKIDLRYNGTSPTDF